MKLHDLRPDPGSKRKKHRIARGISAGQGKTGGRGTKGQHARSGKPKGQYFEGGQLPFVRRLPFKRGFTNLFRIEYQEVNIKDLEARFAAGASVTPAALEEAGLVRNRKRPVVVLGQGELTKALNVSAHRFTAGAQAKITAAGGTMTTLEYNVLPIHVTIRRLPRAQMVELYGDDIE